MGFRQETNDPIIGKLRKGFGDDPYKRIVETLQVHAGVVHLTEIPNRAERIRITSPLFPMREINRGELTENTYRVDYTNGVVFFHSNVNEQYLLFDYMGRGAQFFPASKIYLNYDKDNFTAERKFIDIDREIKSQTSRVDNLLRATPQPSEIVDIRVNRHGYVFPTSKARIDDIEKKIDLTLVGEDGRVHVSLPKRLDTIDKTIDANDVKHTNTEIDLQNQITANKNTYDKYIKDRYDFDYTLIEPVYHTSLNMWESSVNQGFAIDEYTGDIYATQKSALTTPNESYTITRMTRNGNYIDHMQVKNGGHGTSIGLDPDRASGRMFIISNYNTVNANGTVVATNLVRFEYVPNKIINDLTDCTVLNKYQVDYGTPVTDVQNDLIGIRFNPSDDRQYFELRKLSELKSGINNLLGRVNIPRDLSLTQGYTIDGYDLYWYSGDTNSVNYPNELSLFDLKTGTIKKRITVDFGRGIDGKYEDGFREPEGAFLYKDPYTGKKSLFCVVVTGEITKRINKVYAFHQQDNYEKFASEMSQFNQSHPLTGAGGSTKGIPQAYTQLSQIIDAGYYYMNSAESSKYTDHPEAGNAGWHLFVSPITPFGVVLQTLTRNSTNRTIKTYTRNLNIRDGQISSWFIPTANQTLEWVELPLKNGAKNLAGGTPLQFAINGGIIQVKGDVVLPTTPEEMIFASLPKGVYPVRTTHHACIVAGTTGFHRIHARSEGDLVCYGAMMNNNTAYSCTYVDLMYMWS